MSDLLTLAEQQRAGLQRPLRDQVAEAIFGEATTISDRALRNRGRTLALTQRLDDIFTSRIWGFPAMALLFALVFWITIVGSNVPSAMLGELLVGKGHPWLRDLATSAGFPWWLSGLLIDGMYLATAWVISVMLPPMAIFFPLFTLLEDFGYLPRVAFNLDRAFKWSGGHGKQALTMMMGFGCNAAGVTSTRIIDSPRERLIAIITNNFAICNGRWPTLILVSSLFVATMAPTGTQSIVAALTVGGVAVLGIITTILVSKLLSGTLLKGEASNFTLELPPYRPPRIMQTIATSMIDRTLKVLWRAIVMAAPAGLVIWTISNASVGGQTLAAWMVNGLDPIGLFVGLNGVILVAYIVAIPANEIVIPSILMLTLNLAKSGLAQQGVMLELDDQQVRDALVTHGGWTMLTAVNLLLFSLLHNPCSTTIMTIYKETRSVKWTAVATFLPLLLAFTVCTVVAVIWRSFG
ncbi:MAG: ferrous iron transporter B [Methanoregulaceae archaeon]|nr:ferrous iron transporter B [Methanoregulaceae archaeon]